MGRTQNIGTLFSLTQTGNLNPPDVNGDPVGAAWCIASPPVTLVNPPDPLHGNWTVHFRMRGPAREIYRLRTDWPFPFWNQPGLWNELASHRVRDLVAEVESFGPTGIRYFEEFFFEDWVEQKPYLAELTGDAPGVLRLNCGVANVGFHTVTASLFGESFPWQPFFHRIEDQHAPPTGQFAVINVSSTGATVTVNSGGDERFNARVDADFELPLRARVRVFCTDFDGKPLVGKKLAVQFGPVFNLAGERPAVLMDRYRFARETPLDEVFDFPLRNYSQQARFEHVFLNGASGNPSPPFPRVFTWGDRRVYAAPHTVAVAIDPREFGEPALPDLTQIFELPYTDRRNWLRNRFHGAAGVTLQTVATLTLPASLALPSLSWQATSGAIFADQSPAFECRPYRRLRLAVTASTGGPATVVLKQGAVEKRYAVELEAGLNALSIDLANPVTTSPILEHIPREMAFHQGVLSGRFEGIAGLTQIRIEGAMDLTGGDASLGVDAASFSWCGDGSPGVPPDEPLHLAYGQVDGLSAFRVPWAGAPELTLAEFGARQNMEVSDENYDLSDDFLPDLRQWSASETGGTVPFAYRHVANFEANGARIAPVDPRQPFPVRMTLLGQGLQLYPGISQDQMYKGQVPFECNFELLWGPAVAATAVPAHATFEVSRPGFWNRTVTAAPWRVLSGLPLRLAEGTADGAITLAGTSVARSFTAMRQVSAVAGHGRDPEARSVSLATMQHGRTLAVSIHDDGVVGRLFWPPGESRSVDILPDSAADAVVARRTDGTICLGLVIENDIFIQESQAEGFRWSDASMIAAGSEVALAVCFVTGRRMAAIWNAGTWRAHRETDTGWEMVGSIVAAASGARAGLAFANDDPNALLFAAPIAGVIRTYESTDFGSTWEEV